MPVPLPVANGGRGLASIVTKVAGRFSWGLADQGMSSLSNAFVSFYIARELGASKFGAFSLAYVTYSFALNASRGLATDPLLVRYSHTDAGTWRRAVANCTGTALITGLVAGALALVAAEALGGTTRLAFLALGITLPLLMLQDSWRYSFFAAGRGQQAFLNDTIWTVSLLPALLILRVTHHDDVFFFILAWGLAAAVAALAGPFQARVVPSPSGAVTWLSKHRDLGPRYLAENTSNAGASQLRTYGIGIIAGLAAVGYVQAAGLLMGPFLVVFMGISAVTVPEAARIVRRSPRYLLLYCLLVGGGLSVLALAWGGALVFALPRGLGNLLLGKLWEPTAHLVLPGHDRGHGRVPHGRRHRGAPCSRRRAQEPARDGLRVAPLPGLRSAGRAAGGSPRDHSRCRAGHLDRGAAVVAAAARGDAGASVSPRPWPYAPRGSCSPRPRCGRRTPCRCRRDRDRRVSRRPRSTVTAASTGRRAARWPSWTRMNRRTRIARSRSHWTLAPLISRLTSAEAELVTAAGPPRATETTR